MEEWRVIEDFPAYEVSSLGRIRRRDTKRLTKRRPLKTRYLFCQLYAAPGCGRSVAVTPLVAKAFLGPKPPGYQTDHIDFNRANDAVSNLRYITQSQNVKRSVPRRKKAWTNRRLTAKEYAEIKRLWEEGMPQTKIAKLIGCNNSAVSKIVNGHTKCVFVK